MVAVTPYRHQQTKIEEVLALTYSVSVCVFLWILCVSDCMFVGSHSFLYYLFIYDSVGHSRNVLRHSKCVQNMNKLWLSRRYPDFISREQCGGEHC